LNIFKNAFFEAYNKELEFSISANANRSPENQNSENGGE
jgi:hypothetical protein